jgi:hypothetical protein
LLDLAMCLIDADFLNRQRAYLMAVGLDLDEAERRLMVTLPEAATLPAPVERDDALGRHLATLGELSGAAGPSVEIAVRAFRTQVAVALAPLWQAYRGMALHFSLLALVALMVSFVMATYVLPTMDHSYQSLGAELPVLTHLVLTIGNSLWLPIVFLLPAVAAWWWPQRIRAAIELRLAPQSGWLATLLLGRSLRHLWAAYEITVARAAAQAGLAPEQALTLAAGYARGWHGATPHWSGDALERARLAARLGTFLQELGFQRDEHWRQLPLQAGARRDVLATLLSLFLGVTVGAFVIALYIPFFKLAG